MLALALVTGCESGAEAPADTASGSGTAPADQVAPAERAARLAGTLADADLVGQVLMPYAYGNAATEVSASSRAGNRKLAGVDTPAEMVKKFRLGGLILVSFSADDPTGRNQPTTNVDSPGQVHKLTEGLQRSAAGLPAAGTDHAGRAPLLIGTDQEFGVVTRISTGVTMLPGAMAFGAAGDPGLTEAAWRVAGSELAAVGVNVDFAPVADVLGGPGGTVIGSRSYGADPAQAATQVAAAVRGLQGAGVAATLKHFPGHGHTSADSHEGLPVLGQDRAALDRDDLPPFAEGIKAGAELVMSGHLDVRAVDPGVPATFSRKVLTDVLRGQLGFGGVVISDAMNMAPARRWPPAEAAVRALAAGNDLLLMPPDLPAAHAGLVAAVRDGKLPRERLVEAVTRVLTLKFRLADHQRPQSSVVGAEAHREPVNRLAAASITALRGPCGPALVGGPVQVTAARGRVKARRSLEEALRRAGAQLGAGGSTVHLIGYGDERADLSKGASVTVAMDTPYLLGKADSPVLLATYSSSASSMEALAQVLTGKARAVGKSPVAVAGLPRTVC